MPWCSCPSNSDGKKDGRGLARCPPSAPAPPSSPSPPPNVPISDQNALEEAEQRSINMIRALPVQPSPLPPPPSTQFALATLCCSGSENEDEEEVEDGRGSEEWQAAAGHAQGACAAARRSALPRNWPIPNDGPNPSPNVLLLNYKVQWMMAKEEEEERTKGKDEENKIKNKRRSK